MPQRKVFKFEAMWVGSFDCHSLIKNAWNICMNRGDLHDVMRKIKCCKSDLEVWNTESFGYVQGKLIQACYDVSSLQQVDPQGASLQAQKQAMFELQKWLECEKIIWKQQSQALWLKEGDQNTKYFHHKANSQHKKKSTIVRIMDQEVCWQKHGCRDNVTIDYFNQIFTTSDGDGDMGFLDPLEQRVTGDMVAHLSSEFTAVEVYIALHGMHPKKALSRDSMTPNCFFISNGL